MFLDGLFGKFNNKRSAAKNRRNIYFITANNWGTYIMYGFQMSRQLEKMGVSTEVINIYDEPKRIKAVKDSVVVFIKDAPKTHHRIIRKLKRQNNILIWSPVDGFANVTDEPWVKMFDGALVSNTLCQTDWRPYFHKDCRCEVLYLHWDPRCVFNRAKEYRLVYAGIIVPDNISEEYLKRVEGLNTIEINTTDPGKQNEIFTQVLDYNCHFSVRQEGSESFKYKTNSKLTFAAGTNSNIILSRDQAHVELLDGAYPYYTGSDIDDVIKTVKYARETYGTKVWNEALEMMREVRERTSIERTSRDFLNYLAKF